MSAHHLMSGGRYPVLRSLALLYLIGAAVAIVGGVLAMIWALAWAPDSMSHRVVLALGVLAATFFVVISMLAIAEVLKLFMDIEHNSRMIRLGTPGSVAISNAAPATMGCITPISDLDEET